MTTVANTGITDDVHICSSSVFSHYVQVGRVHLIQVDVLPFLMQSQIAGGYDTSWFTKDHLHESLTLLRPVLESCIKSKLDSELKTSEKSNSCIFTGETVRVACTFKQLPECNLYLITHFSKHKKNMRKASSKDPPSFQERVLYKEKLVVFVCPRTSSSVLQLSQLVHADVDMGRSQEDISKYFLPSLST